MGELNVSFQSDTDNIENFPSRSAFDAFRKQRDLFYEIFRTWQENHLTQQWSFQMTLAGKIQSMLRMHNDAANYCHFARLFKSQLLISCIQNTHEKDVADDESLSFLRTLKHVNPEKLTQLRKRLVTPLPPKDHVGEPSFPGVQEFFKDFIIHAFNPIFYVHLENCLVREIMELNDTQFASSEIEDSDTMVDERTQQNFTACLSSLRLLAKVLGLLVSLPYKLTSHSTEATIASQVDMRSRVSPALNLEACLRNALLQRNLSLAVPWMVEYLAMMDVVTLRLPYYKRILEVLYYIHWIIKHSDLSTAVANVNANTNTNSTEIDSMMSKRTALLLKTILEWLFELSNFPKDQYAPWAVNCASLDLKSLRQLDKHCVETNLLSPMLVESITSAVPPAKGNLDKLDIINDRILRACCPTLELKVATAAVMTTATQAAVPTTTQNVHLNRGPSSKHITLVSSQLCKKTSDSAGAKHLQAKLEDAFFHGQPASTRKTVDFIAERVASTCVKHICNTVLSSARENNLTTFKKIMMEQQNERQLRQQQQREEERRNSADESDDLPKVSNTSSLVNSSNDVEDFKFHLVRDMNMLALNQSKHLKDECERTVLAICEARVGKAIESLLAEDSLPAVKETCVKIAVRLAMGRINEWVQSHIVGGSLFIKDMEVEMNRFLRNSSPLYSAHPRQHNPNAPSPVNVMHLFRSLIWEMIENGGQCLTEAIILSASDSLHETLHKRGDLLPCPEKILISLSVDFALFLVSYRLDLCTDQIQDKLIQVWSTKHSNAQDRDSPMLRLLSPRNVMLLAQSGHLDIWVTFGRFIRKLLIRNILDIDVLGDQCVALFRQCWPMPILRFLSKCLREAIEDYDASGEEAEKVKDLLGWIAETYHELETYDDSEVGN